MAKIEIEESKLMSMIMSSYLDGNLVDIALDDNDTLSYAKRKMHESGLIKTDLVIPWELFDERLVWACQDPLGEVKLSEYQPIIIKAVGEKYWGMEYSLVHSFLRNAQLIKGVIPSNKPWNETLVKRPVKE